MSEQIISSRGRTWFEVLSAGGTKIAGLAGSVLAADKLIGSMPARLIAIVPDAANRFPRAARGEVGLLEGWNVARVVREVIAADQDQTTKRAIIAIVDVPSQAYGRREEAYGIHQALAAAGGAYASARLAGHPVVALIVGKAMSGGFLAHGYQANRLIAFNDPGVVVHAMNKAAAARITLRSVEELEALAEKVPPMAYDIRNYATLGLLWKLIDISAPECPSNADLATAQDALLAAIADIAQSPRDLSGRLHAKNRQASRHVRELLRAQWQ
ncbi:MAG: biotin-independent malonate decarboxylase subunit gamma [Formivibrio sp.]|nr:biotin-independent malonate decarboxylase subunit gamma [Formivibrio sp.]